MASATEETLSLIHSTCGDGLLLACVLVCVCLFVIVYVRLALKISNTADAIVVVGKTQEKFCNIVNRSLNVSLFFSMLLSV